MAHMSTKFDQESHNSLVDIVFTSKCPYMSIVTLTFDVWPPKSIGCILLPWLKLDLYDKKQPTNKLKVRILSETSIPYLIRHASFILIVSLHL